MHLSEAAFPEPADRQAAEQLIEAFVGENPADPVTADPAWPRLLACLGGNSPYLSDLARSHPEWLRRIFVAGPDAVCDQMLGELAALSPAQPRPVIAAGLRRAKKIVALATAVADLGSVWGLEAVTGALSDLADGALRVIVAHLLAAAHARRELRLPHPATPERGSGFVVLAMGKLGARALNFSSDVDLILLFDPERHPYDADGLGAIFARMARDLVALMQARDADGYVFRTDLRLRPDPASTPPAIALPGALAYYESQAQTWERAALIKARPVAGDLALGRRFLEAIRPFVWRRHLDFAAIADLHAMKQRMDEHRGTPLSLAGTGPARLLGHDLKLGEGGIREVEFCGQALQLVWGGRNPALRVPGTLAALRAVSAAGHLPAALCESLATAYPFLRRAEHRLQMVNDRQTHTLPTTEAGLASFAVFLGFPDAETFAHAALPLLEQVRAAFVSLLPDLPEPPDLSEAPPATTPTPAAPATHPPAGRNWASALQAWSEAPPRAFRSDRARSLLGEMLPSIRAMLARQPEPEQAFTRFADLVHGVPAGVQLLSVFRHNPAVLERLGDVLGAAPSLADHLASVPAALEGLIYPGEIDLDPAATLAAQLRDAAGLDQALSIASRMIRGEEFRLAVAELDGRLSPDRAGLARTALADAAITCLLPRVLADHARRYGRVRGGGIVVVAMGKAGSREMMSGSDLDLMLIYDHPENVTESRGSRPLPSSQYFTRAAHAVVAALTVPTRDGPLYEVDMRLRPSGRKGPVAVSLAAFEKYHRDDAWTWERLALTRARVVAGPAALKSRVTRAIAAAIRQGDPATIRPDTAAMRSRLLRELPPQGEWDVKLRPGGLLEVEFIAQALQLRHAGRAKPNPTTRLALANLAAGGVLPPTEADALIEADLTWRRVQGLLRITQGRKIPATLPAPVLAKLLPGLGTDLPSLRTHLTQLAARVRASFIELIGDVEGTQASKNRVE